MDLLTSPYAVRAKTLATSEGCLRAIYQIMNLNLNLHMNHVITLCVTIECERKNVDLLQLSHMQLGNKQYIYIYIDFRILLVE